MLILPHNLAYLTRNSFNLYSFALLLLAVRSSDAGALGRTLQINFNEFDALLTLLSLFLSAAGLFVCIWCTCCGHQDYFISMDQRRLLFRQQAIERAAKHRSSTKRKKKYSYSKKNTPLPVTFV